MQLYHFKSTAGPVRSRQVGPGLSAAVYRSRARDHRIRPQAARRSAYDLKVELFRSLIKQAQTTTFPAIAELAQPWFSWSPEPLTGVLDPEQLADADSKFVRVHGIQLHYKDLTFYPGSSPSSSNGTTTTTSSSSNGTTTSSSSNGTSSSSSVHASSNGNAPGSSDAASTAAGAQPHPQEPLTLLFIHGFNGWLFNWRMAMPGIGNMVAQLGRPCRVIAFDRPPFGLSERPLQWDADQDNPYAQGTGAKLAQGLLQALGVGQCVVVGHSAGAGVAVDLALRDPSRVSALVLVSPALATQPRNFLANADLGQLLRFAASRALLATEGPGLTYVRNMIDKRRREVERGENTGTNDQLDDAAAAGYLRPLQARDWDKAVLLMYRSFGTSWGVPDYDQLHMPVLVVQGDQDTAVPRSMALDLTQRLRQRPGATASAAGTSTDSTRSAASSSAAAAAEAGSGNWSPATEYVELEACGHIPMDEYPLEFDAAVVGFLQQHAWGAAASPPQGQQVLQQQPVTRAVAS